MKRSTDPSKNVLENKIKKFHDKAVQSIYTVAEFKQNRF